jgi:hypothetical protein
MNTILKEQIEKFYASGEKLETRMMNLAKYFLCGGYVNVRNQYHIYIKTVEFYYHEEEGEIKDPIMYHRNNYFVQGDVPYFTPLSFNSHDTGVDITFENEIKKIRASVLIRAYEVFDCKNGIRLVWNPVAEQFQQYVEAKTKYKYNTQCLYLKRILNGFTSEETSDIIWMDDDLFDPEDIHDKDITPVRRQGVYESSNNDRYEANREKKDERKWGFRREKDIVLQ